MNCLVEHRLELSDNLCYNNQDKDEVLALDMNNCV